MTKRLWKEVERYFWQKARAADLAGDYVSLILILQLASEIKGYVSERIAYVAPECSSK